MSLHKPSRFCLINIGEMYSPVSCSHFDTTHFAKSFWISEFMAGSSYLKIEQYRSYFFSGELPKNSSFTPSTVVSLYHSSALFTFEKGPRLLPLKISPGSEVCPDK